MHTRSVVIKSVCLYLCVYGGVKFHRKSIKLIKLNTLELHVIKIAKLPDLLKTGKSQALLVWLLPLSLPCGRDLVNTSCALQTGTELKLQMRRKGKWQRKTSKYVTLLAVMLKHILRYLCGNLFLSLVLGFVQQLSLE